MRFSKLSSLMMALILLICVIAPVSAQDSPVKVIPVPGMMFGSLLSPDGKLLVMFESSAVHNDEVDPLFLALRLLDVESGEMRLLSGHTDYATDATFSPDGSMLASYHINGYIYLWDVASGDLIKTLPALPGNARIIFHPDGKSLVGMVGNSLMVQIAVWDTDTGYITALLMPRLLTWRATMDRKTPFDTGVQMALSPDGTQVAVATMYNNIQLWDLTTGDYEVVAQSAEELPRIDIRTMAFTPDGSRLDYHHWGENTIYSIDTATGTKSALIENAPKSIFAISPDGSRIAWVNGEDHTFYVDSLEQPGTPASVPLPIAEDYELRIQPRLSSLTFTPDGGQVVFTGFYSSDGMSNAVVVIPLP